MYKFRLVAALPQDSGHKYSGPEIQTNGPDHLGSHWDQALSQQHDTGQGRWLLTDHISTLKGLKDLVGSSAHISTEPFPVLGSYNESVTVVAHIAVFLKENVVLLQGHKAHEINLQLPAMLNLKTAMQISKIFKLYILNLGYFEQMTVNCIEINPYEYIYSNFHKTRTLPDLIMRIQYELKVNNSLISLS